MGKMRGNTAASSGIPAAFEHAECAICFDDLYTQTTAVFCDHDLDRVCKHFFHQKCVDGLAPKICPVCRCDYSVVVSLPEIDENPHAWFELVDLNHDGVLNKEEVLEVLKAQLPIDWRLLEQNIDTLFLTWDINGNGVVDEHELMNPENGIVAFVRKAFGRQNRSTPPSLEDCRHNWFRFWDEDQSNTLDKHEITRALVKTFDLEGNPDRIASMQEVVDSIWPIFDLNCSQTIDLDEFIQEGGFAEAIIASIRYQ